MKCFFSRMFVVMLLMTTASSSHAQSMKPEEILARKPMQASANITMPTSAELASLKVEPVAWPKQGSGPSPTGIILKDAQGRTLRQFIDTTGRNQPNIFSFFLNGTEAYREIDSNTNGKPDQFRWLGQNGTRWGIDQDEDGTIDRWYILSPEELSQELFQGLATKDNKRIQALLPSESELKEIGLPEVEIQKIMQRSAGVLKKVQESAASMNLPATAKWVHLETGIPQATPADSFGGKIDLIRHKTGAVLYDKGDGKSADVFQTGEMLLVGQAWKIIDGPTPGSNSTNLETTAVLPADVQKLIKDLSDKVMPNDPAELTKYHTERGVILESIVGKVQGADQEPWLKQVIDAYASAAETAKGDDAAYKRLKEWQNQIEKAAPRSGPAAYAAFRVISAEYAMKLAAPKPDINVVQGWWREQLESFLSKHNGSEEAPEAMLRLASAHEFGGKDGDAQAKAWYEKLASTFKTHPHAIKAEGAIRRLTSEGQVFNLPPVQTIDGRPFSTAEQLNGKVTVVYYWASWGRDSIGELKILADMVKTYGSKGMQVVTISLDEDTTKATQGINTAQLIGFHLHQPGGLERSPLANAYGIQIVPHIFVVGKDGKVVNRNAQNGPILKDEIEKLLK